MHYYRLEGKTPVIADDFDSAFKTDRRVARTEVGDVVVSTVFLVIDHNHFGGGGPILFETMVFGGSLDQEMKRYRTWDEAAAGHEEMVALVKAAQPRSE